MITLRHRTMQLLLHAAVLMLFAASGVFSQARYRVLVAYTPAAQQRIERFPATVRDYINAWCVNTLNTIYNGSFDIGAPIAYQVELAGIAAVNYVEVDMVTDITALRNGTGVFAGVHILRDRYSADVVVLLTGKRGYSGATLIPPPPAIPDATHGFCVVDWEYARLRFTTAHEIGHIFGKAHAPWDPQPDSPWQYGHGWGDRPTQQNPSGTWGTVMCYNNNRQPFYSNPDREFNGVARGDRDTADNARVLEENHAGVNNFRTTPANVTVQSDTVGNQEYGEVLATNSIATGTGVALNAGGELILRSTGAITLNSGITVQNGSVLTLRSGSGALAKSLGGNSAPPPQIEKIAAIPVKSSFNCVIKQGVVSLDYTLSSATNVRFQIFDAEGKLVAARDRQLQQPGSHRLRLPIPGGASPGMYVFRMVAGNVSFHKVVSVLE